MAAELIARAGPASPSSWRTPAEEAAALWPPLAELIRTVESNRFDPIRYRADGVPVGFSPFPYVHLTDLKQGS